MVLPPIFLPLFKMPISEIDSFVARGSMRNGFPICIPEIDVSNYEFVNAMSIKEASNIFYNLASLDIQVGLKIEQTFNNYDETVEFTEISDPNADPSISVNPFKIGTVHTENAHPVYDESGIIDVNYVLDDYSNYQITEPYNKIYSCGGQNQPSTYRTKFASDQVSSVIVSCNFNQFYRLYTKESDLSPKEYKGYGFAMGAITMFAGITSLNGNQISYGNFANDLDYVQTSPWMPPNWWGAQPGLWLGQSLLSTSAPESVTSITLDFSGSLFNADFIQASWTGRDSSFPATWSVPPLVGDRLIPYEYI
ncbi:MAG: hypothetical protein OQK81_01640 [Candidatus Bathyarchaeota archaeon]|jgi:hypothetical protein|nr:hypothetical protein [Candidatus Bathyarchaeota archaeon]